jgi:DNA repair exonuclease SbcCD ATPase subunit
MKIKFLEVENILSIGKIRIEFSDTGLVLLDGWNHDDGSANGAGKTAVPNALSYALYDKIPRKISKTEIVRRGTKKGYSHVGIQAGSDYIEVKRFRPKNTEFYLNGVKADMTQEEFESKIKMTYNQFLVCMYAAQTEGKRFMSLNDTEKKDFILNLMNLDKFLLKKKEVDIQVKELNTNKVDVEKLLVSCQSKRSVYEDQLVDTSEIMNTLQGINISALEQKLKDLHQVQRPDNSKYEEVRKKARQKLQELDKIEQEVSANRLQLKLVQSEIDRLESYNFNDAIECPSCHERFVESPSGSVKIEQLQKEHDDKILTKKEELKEIVARINGAPNTRAKRDEIAELMQKILKKEQQEQQAYYDAVTRISDLKSKIDINKNKVATLNDILSKQQGFTDKIAEIDGLASKANSKLAKINTDINVLTTISSILSPTGAPAYIVDSIVDIFNEKVSDFVSMIWPNATYSLQAFKENKAGDVKAKFSDKLVIAGRDVSIGSLSGGEFRCLSLAVDFAITDVVESVFGFELSPVFLDEPFDGLDLSNRERVVDLLEKLSVDRQIWIIDHASEAKSMFSDVVRIEKKNGVSDII